MQLPTENVVLILFQEVEEEVIVLHQQMISMLQSMKIDLMMVMY